MAAYWLFDLQFVSSQSATRSVTKTETERRAIQKPAKKPAVEVIKVTF